jgi:hypothetical protein
MAGKKIELLCDECLAIAKDRSSACILEKQMCAACEAKIRLADRNPLGPSGKENLFWRGAWCAGRSCDASRCVVAMNTPAGRLVDTGRSDAWNAIARC